VTGWGRRRTMSAAARQQMLPDLKAWEANPPEAAPQLLAVSTGSVEENRLLAGQAPPHGLAEQHPPPARAELLAQTVMLEGHQAEGLVSAAGAGWVVLDPDERPVFPDPFGEADAARADPGGQGSRNRGLARTPSRPIPAAPSPVLHG
jgi:hypothetical protein